MPEFVHLNIHSEYSLVDGLVRIEPLIKSAVEMDMPAIAITDMGNIFAAIKFYKAAVQHGIKPVIGAEVRVMNNDQTSSSSRLILLCQNLEGYRNLCILLTRSFKEGQIRGINYIKKDWLKERSENLIALSGGMGSDVGQAILSGNDEQTLSCIHTWQSLFPDRYYLELHRTGRPGEEKYLHAAINLAAKRSLPVVATNDVRFIKEEDYEAHEARICIQHGYILGDNRREKHYSQAQYLRTPEEMTELFHDIPEAIENSWLISQRCNLEFSLGMSYLPHFPVPENRTQDDWLDHEARSGLKNRLSEIKTRNKDFSEETYQSRLDAELQVIINMGFPGYFLIVADFIKWAKSQGIPVGPGRGSGAGSLVAYALGITELDPLEYDLLFERFLNPERVSLPDFDIDFCMERRDEVIEYVSERYGNTHVAQIITFGTMAAKAVVRDAGRVLGYPYGFVDKIAKLIPFDIHMTLNRALEEEEILRKRYKEEEEVTNLIDLAIKLEGLTRNAGKHAGGIVIAPEPLTNYMPLYCEQGSNTTVTQFDMGDVESIGLVKFDFLGLRTLTIIDWAVRDINKLNNNGDQKLDIKSIPLDDPATYKLIRKTETTAIFQLESDGMKKLIKRLRPDNFNDLIALVALFRPGPLQSGMVDDYMERKHGRSRIQYPHEDLADILHPTYGVILYQEQVMEIAQVLAGYTLGSADILRRAMGKKKPEEMATQREHFIAGALKNNVNQRTAAYIFELMEKFAGYGFNKSHSAAYALVAYQTAWLKTHYPAAFMAAVLSSDMDNTDKVVMLLDELHKMEIVLNPPDINESMYYFTVANSNSINYGLGAIKGVGHSAIDNIIMERKQNGVFKDLFDFCNRIDHRKVNRRAIEPLIRSGALDQIGPGRSRIMASLEKALHLADQLSQDNDVGQNDLFGLMPSRSGEESKSDMENSFYVDTPEWSDEYRLAGEKESLGFYLEGHPINRYEAELETLITSKLNSIKPGHIVTAGYINRVRTRSGTRGKMAELQLDDRTARASVTVYSEVFQEYRHLLVKDQLIILKGEVVIDDYLESGYSIIAKEIRSLEEARKQSANLKIRLPCGIEEKNLMSLLHDILSNNKSGYCPVSVEYFNDEAKCVLNLGSEWKVNLDDILLDSLRKKFGEENINITYNGL